MIDKEGHGIGGGGEDKTPTPEKTGMDTSTKIFIGVCVIVAAVILAALIF